MLTDWLTEWQSEIVVIVAIYQIIQQQQKYYHTLGKEATNSDKQKNYFNKLFTENKEVHKKYIQLILSIKSKIYLA